MFNLRPNHPKERPPGRSGLGVASHDLCKKAGKVFLLPDDPGMPGNEGMRADDLSADPDDHLVALDFQNSLSPGVSVGHRVAVAKIGDIRFTRDLAAFFPAQEVGRDPCHGLQVLPLQPFKRDLVGGAVGFGIDSVAPLQELPVHIVKRSEGSSEEEVPFHIPDRILDLSFGLRAVGSAEPGNEPVMPEEVLEHRVPLVVAGAERPFEDHRFDVVVEDLLGMPTKVLEGIDMALDESIGIRGEGEDHVPHPGVPEDHAEAVQFSPPSIHIQMPAFSPIHLCLNAGFGLIPEDRRHTLGWPDLPDIVFDDCILPRETPFLDLPTYPGGTQGMFANALLNILLEWIEFARFAGSRLRGGRCPGREVFAYGLAIKPSSLGDLTDVQSLIVEIADHQEFLHREHCHNPQARA